MRAIGCKVIMVQRGINYRRGEQASESEAQARKGSKEGKGRGKQKQKKSEREAKQNKAKERGAREQSGMKKDAIIGNSASHSMWSLMHSAFCASRGLTLAIHYASISAYHLIGKEAQGKPDQRAV